MKLKINKTILILLLPLCQFLFTSAFSCGKPSLVEELSGQAENIIERGDVEEMRNFIREVLPRQGYNINSFPYFGKTLLESMIGSNGPMKMIRLFFQEGANPNSYKLSKTPLWQAILQNRNDIVGLLVNRDANPNLPYRDEGGVNQAVGTPLNYARQAKKLELAQLLLQSKDIELEPSLDILKEWEKECFLDVDPSMRGAIHNLIESVEKRIEHKEKIKEDNAGHAYYGTAPAALFSSMAASK